MVLNKSSIFDSSHCDCLYLYNSGKENVPVYVGAKDAVNPNPNGNGLGVIIRFKAVLSTTLLGWIVPEQCVKIEMGQYSNGFLKVISVVELYKAWKEKSPRHMFKQIVPR
jgi:hypothetical protein